MLITLQAEQTIQKILSRPFPQILKDLENKDSVGKILRLFAYKRKDIGVIFGMQYIAAIFSAMFVVETDAFIMFCYVYENLYPPVCSK